MSRDHLRRGRDLAPVGPLGAVDRAFTLARSGGSEVLVSAWVGGALFAGALLGIYYVERIEGITGLRPALALGLVLAWWARALLVGRAARVVASQMWGAEPEPDAGRAVDVLRTSLVVGLGLWFWSWLLVLGSLGGVLGVLLVCPFFVFRGLVAPSWLARAACTSQAGWRGFFAAARDHDGQRLSGLFTEGLFLLGMVGLLLNLLGVTAAAVVLARSFMGLEIAALESFLSVQNTFALLAIAATALVLFEPVRAAHSAGAYVDARVREDGLDLRARVEEAIGHSSRDRKGGALKHASRAAVILLGVWFASSGAHAQQAPLPPPPDFSIPESVEPEPPMVEPVFEPAFTPAPPMPTVVRPTDTAVQGDVETILERSEFREFEDQRGAGLREMIERLLDWLRRPRPELPQMHGPRLPSIPLPGPMAFLVLGALLLLGVALYLLFTRARTRREAQASFEAAATSADIRDRPPASFLDEAAQLAEAGQLREALRALYLATLVALDRRRWIAFDPHLTNWQYLRQMPRGDVRDAFRSFTRLFDHKWYGHEETVHDDYERCHALASEIVDGAGDPR